MAALDDLDDVVEQYHLALGEFMKGNPEPAKKLFSHQEDSPANWHKKRADERTRTAELLIRSEPFHRRTQGSGLSPKLSSARSAGALLV
jgi:hypothetical protein